MTIKLDLIESAVQGSVKDATSMIDISLTDWDEEAKATAELHKEHYGSGQCGFMAGLNEANLVNIIWTKLPSHLKSKVDIKKLTKFVGSLEGGDSLATAARSSSLSNALAVDLLTSIENLGLL